MNCVCRLPEVLLSPCSDFQDRIMTVLQNRAVQPDRGRPILTFSLVPHTQIFLQVRWIIVYCRWWVTGFIIVPETENSFYRLMNLCPSSLLRNSFSFLLLFLLPKLLTSKSAVTLGFILSDQTFNTFAILIKVWKSSHSVFIHISLLQSKLLCEHSPLILVAAFKMVCEPSLLVNESTYCAIDPSLASLLHHSAAAVFCKPYNKMSPAFVQLRCSEDTKGWVRSKAFKRFYFEINLHPI